MPTTGILPAANAAYNAPIQGYFPGQTVAGLSPWTQNSWGQGMNAAQGVQNMGNQALNRWQTGFDMGQQGNPWLQGHISNMQDSMYQAYDRNTAPAQRLGAAANEQYGSTRHGIAEGIARGDLNRAVGDMTQQMNSDAYTQQLGHTSNMTGQMPNLMGVVQQTAMTPFNMMQGIGDQQRGYNQQLLDEEKNRWDYNAQEPWNRLNQISGMYNNLPISNTQKSSGSGFDIGYTPPP